MHFVDYGNVETVSKQYIRELTEEFMDIPPQALLVHLEGVNSGSRSDQTLKTNLEFKEVWIKLGILLYLSF